LKIKTNIRAGQGGTSSATASGQTQTQTGKGGVNSSHVTIVYTPPVLLARCVGL
jgi:hypothetical protein